MRKFLLMGFLWIPLFVLGQTIDIQSIPIGYYDTATETGYNLKTQLYTIIKEEHIPLSYTPGLWDLYKTENAFKDQWYENDGTLLDIYSEIPNATDPYNFNLETDQCGSGGKNAEGDCYNREHLIPQSVFKSQYPMYTDAFHIWPTDKWVNAKRANFPFGRVGNATWISLNDSKLGSADNSGYSAGYSGTVFEPIDEFKGDIARAYFYFATRYENLVNAWSSYEMFNGTNNQVFTDTFKNILLTWHQIDPVSPREIGTNEAIYAKQKNRNPYIDHPEWVKTVWGRTLGVDDFKYQPREFLEIYPTLSSNGIVYIKSKYEKTKIKKILVFNMSGILIQTIDNFSNSQKVQIQIINSGVYIIKVLGIDFEVNRKVMVK